MEGFIMKFFLLKHFFFFYLLVPFFFTNEANATIYYVATVGNDSNPGTEAQPWATF